VSLCGVYVGMWVCVSVCGVCECVVCVGVCVRGCLCA